MCIRRMDKSESFEILELWMRSMTHGNDFIESDFWQKHYDKAKEMYLNEKDNFVYIKDEKIVGFICIDSENSVGGVFVDPDYENQGIGTALMNFIKNSYTLLHLSIFMKNRRTLAFANYHDFVIDGAEKDSISGEIQYTMIWQKE